MGYVAAVLKTRGPGPVPLQQAHLAGLFGSSRPAIGMAISRLVESRFLKRVGRGIYELTPRGIKFVDETDSVSFPAELIDLGFTPKQAAIKTAGERAGSQRKAARWLNVDHRTVGRASEYNTVPHENVTQRPKTCNPTPQTCNPTPHVPNVLIEPNKGALEKPPCSMEGFDKATDAIVNRQGRMLTPIEIRNLRIAWIHSKDLKYTTRQMLRGIEWLYKRRKFKRVQYIVNAMMTENHAEHPAGKAKAEEIQTLESEDVARQREHQAPPKDEDARMFVKLVGDEMAKPTRKEKTETEHTKRVREQADKIRRKGGPTASEGE